MKLPKWSERLTSSRIRSVVPQVVDQDLSFASRLWKRCCVGARIRLRDGLAHGAREVEAFGDGSFAFEGHDDVHAAAASRLDPGSQVQRLEDIAHERGGLHDLLPRHQRSRIEIPDEPVRAVDVGGGRIPGVDLDDPHLRQGHDSLNRVRHEVLADLGLLWIRTLRSAFGPQAFACFR